MTQRDEILTRQLQGRSGGRKWRSGTATLTWAGTTDSATVSVPHGLGKVPASVTATSKDAPAFGKIPNCNAFDWTDTEFFLNAELKSSHTGDIEVSWDASA